MEIKAIGCEPLQLKRMHIKDGHTLKVYRETGGYKSRERRSRWLPPISLRKSRNQLFGAAVVPDSDRFEVVVCAERLAEDQILSFVTPTNPSQDVQGPLSDGAIRTP
ncbi:MAG: hypothetical protein IPQ00_17985 [Chloracidobacterium sp.]|nr:hypothetical protein [Chloracidobacterium sp.]